MKIEKTLKLSIASLLSVLLPGCAGSYLPGKPLVPAIEYAKQVQGGSRVNVNAHEIIQDRYKDNLNAQKGNPHKRQGGEYDGEYAAAQDREGYEYEEIRAAMDPRAAAGNLQPYGPPSLNPRDYNGPLSLGDPGQLSSLWRESGTGQDFFRDVRAWQPMDLITVTIVEKTEGKKEADTEVKGKSSISAAISNLLGFEADFIKSNPDASLSSLIGANTQNDFKGEGETTRKDSLKGSISAMVVEVLPTGIIRIEGTKIISVNNEEQVMVMTGLVRPRDISSENIVESSRIANMRIDYYGRGQLGDAQREGWLGRSLRTIWPF